MNAAAILALLNTLAAAQPSARPLPLGAAVEAALSASPGIEAASERVKEAQAGVSQARLSALPRLTAKSLATRGDDPVYVFGSLLEQNRFGPQNFAIGSLNNPAYLTNIKSSLELGVPLFTGFALKDRRELSRIQLAATGAAARGADQAERYQVTEAYLRVLLARALTADAGDRIASASASLDEARKLRSRGLVLGSDFYAAEALLGALQASQVRAEGELAASRETLEVLVGARAGPVEPVGSLDEAGYSTAPLSALLEGALRERDDLKQAAAAEEAAAVLTRRERFSVLPTVDAFASVETNTSDFSSNPTNRMIGIRAALPIGDPAYFERGKQAAAARRAARAGREASEQAAAIEVRQRYQEFLAAAALLPILRASAEKADKSLELFRPLYREGRQSILDVLRAEEALMKARAAYLDAVFRTHTGYARLQLAAGRLDAAAIAEIERRLGGAK